MFRNILLVFLLHISLKGFAAELVLEVKEQAPLPPISDSLVGISSSTAASKEAACSSESSSEEELSELLADPISEPHSFLCLKSVTQTNKAKLAAAFVLTTGGAILGAVPTLTAVVLGSALGGFGNAASTRLYLVGKDEQQIEAKILKKLPQLRLLVDEEAKQLDFLAAKIQEFHKRSLADIVHDATSPDKLQLTREDRVALDSNASWFWRTRNRRNAMSAFIASSSTLGGALLQGLLPTLPYILVGGALQGIGNTASTKYSWEKPQQKVINLRATIDLPSVISLVTEDAKKLDALTLRLHELSPQTGIEKLIKLKVLLAQNKGKAAARLKDSRTCKNIASVSLAGGPSTLGGLLGGGLLTGALLKRLPPNVYEVLGGSVVGAIGNGMSTFLMWLKKNEVAVDNLMLVEFPKIVRIANANSRKLDQLFELVASL